MKGLMSMKESVLYEKGTSGIADKKEVLFDLKPFILRKERFAKVLPASGWLQGLDKYWEDYEKRCLFRKWQSFQQSGHWF